MLQKVFDRRFVHDDRVVDLAPTGGYGSIRTGQHTAVCDGRHVTLYRVTASTAVLGYAHVALGQDFGVFFRQASITGVERQQQQRHPLLRGRKEQVAGNMLSSRPCCALPPCVLPHSYVCLIHMFASGSWVACTKYLMLSVRLGCCDVDRARFAKSGL